MAPTRPLHRSAAMLAAVLIAALPWHAVRAEDAATPAPAAKDAPASAPAKDSKPAAAITGFRSALFGMTEAEVRQAIKKDFNLDKGQITLQTPAVERTDVLGITVNDLIPGGGTARISYVLGYQSKKLVQVTVQWGIAIDKTVKPENVFSTAQILANSLSGRSYAPDSVVTDQGRSDGTIVKFKAADADGRTVMVLMATEAVKDKDQQLLRPIGVTLSYVLDFQNPDIFRLKEGQF